MTDTVKQVYTAINAVQAEFCSSGGISKDRKNQQQGYSFRGIDDVYNALSPLLAKHGLVIIPRHISRSCEERTTSKEKILFYVTVESEFDIISAADGSVHVARAFGEAMDSADKATNKAMSAAYKYMAMQLFAIPTEGDNDADSHTPELSASPEGKMMLLGAAEFLPPKTIGKIAAKLEINPNAATVSEAKQIIAAIKQQQEEV